MEKRSPVPSQNGLLPRQRNIQHRYQSQHHRANKPHQKIQHRRSGTHVPPQHRRNRPRRRQIPHLQHHLPKLRRRRGPQTLRPSRLHPRFPGLKLHGSFRSRHDCRQRSSKSSLQLRAKHNIQERPNDPPHKRHLHQEQPRRPRHRTHQRYILQKYHHVQTDLVGHLHRSPANERT